MVNFWRASLTVISLRLFISRSAHPFSCSSTVFYSTWFYCPNLGWRSVSHLRSPELTSRCIWIEVFGQDSTIFWGTGQLFVQVSGRHISASGAPRVSHIDWRSLAVFNYSGSFAAVSHFKTKVVRFRSSRSFGLRCAAHLWILPLCSQGWGQSPACQGFHIFHRGCSGWSIFVPKASYTITVPHIGHSSH